MHLRTRQSPRRILVTCTASVVVAFALVGCGLQGFNTPPGPNAPPAPLQCDVEVIKDSTLPVWKTLTLSATFNACAGCHIAGDPLGTGLGWGVANDTSDEGWHWATLQLMARDTGVAGDNVALAPFYKNFVTDAADPTHPENTTAQTELATVYAEFRASGGTACAGDPILNGDCENPAFAKFVELGLGTSINTCATCHFTGTKTGRGINWGQRQRPVRRGPGISRPGGSSCRPIKWVSRRKTPRSTRTSRPATRNTQRTTPSLRRWARGSHIPHRR
jgi:hypothetical protein